MALPSLTHGPGDFSPFVNVGAIIASDSQQRQLSAQGIKSKESPAIMQMKQLFFLKKMSMSLENIEAILGKSALLEQQRNSTRELTDIESDREAGQEKKGGMLEKIAGGVAKLGLKALAGASLFGVLGGLTKWGESIQPILDKFQIAMIEVQGWFDKLGITIAELTGNKMLGRLITMIPLLTAVIGAAIVVAPGTTAKVARAAGAPIRAAAGGVKRVFNFAKGIGESVKGATAAERAGSLVKAVGDSLKGLFEPVSKFLGSFSKLGPIFKAVLKFAKAIPVVGQIVMVLEGLFGTITGFITGFKEGGILEGIKQAILGGIDGLIGSLVDMVVHSIGWIIQQLGFEEYGKKLRKFKFSKMLDAALIMFGYGIELLLFKATEIIDNVRNSIADVVLAMAKAVNKVPLVGDKLATPMYKASIALRPDNSAKREAPVAPDWGALMDDMYSGESEESNKEIDASTGVSTDIKGLAGRISEKRAAVDARVASEKAAVTSGGIPPMLRAPSGSSIGNAGQAMQASAAGVTYGTDSSYSDYGSGGSPGSASLSSGPPIGNIDTNTLWAKVSPLIAKGESMVRGKSPYNVQNGAPGSYTPGLSNMTIAEVIAHSNKINNQDGGNPGITGAAGKYQFMSLPGTPTLQNTAKAAGISLNTKFSPAIQEKLARTLFDQTVKRGAKGGATGIAEALAGVWASLPSPARGGASRYGHGNKAHISLREMYSAMQGSVGTGAMVATASKPAAVAPASASSGPALATASSATSPAALAATSGGNATNINAPSTHVASAGNDYKAPSRDGAMNAVTPPEFAPMVV